MQDDMTKMTKGELIQSLNEAGASKEQIAEWLQVREALVATNKAESRLQATLNDPVVQRAKELAKEHQRKSERRSTIVWAVLGALFWLAMLYFVFINPFVR